MVDEILAALLWRARLGLRVGMLRAAAGHGYVDPSYRPPIVPYVSVVGPLSLAVEPERENGRTGQALLTVPGHVIGAVRPPDLVPPAAGTLRLRFNRRATVTLALALPATSFGDPATGDAVAVAITAGIVAAITAGEVRDPQGAVITDAATLTAVRAATARWSPDLRQLAIVADGVTDESTVEIIPGPDDLSPALGLAPPAVSRTGRRHLHKLPPPKAMTIEMRLDLWTSTQTEMAAMFDGLAAGTPTRGKLLVRPSLLARDGGLRDTTLRLLDAGEPTTPDSVVHLEGGDGLVDRVRDVAFTASDTAAHEPDRRRFRISGTGRLTATVYRPPLRPDPLFATDPAPLGIAAAIGVALDPGSAEGDRYQLFSIRRGAATVLAAEILIERLPSGPPPQTALFGRVTVSADVRRGNVTVPVLTRCRLPLATLEQGGTLHAQLSTETGAIALWFDGLVQRVDDAAVAAGDLVVAGPSTTSAGLDMAVTLGSATAQPRPFSITHFHLSREPLGALDPRVRTSVTRAARLRPGDVIVLAPSNDGWQVEDGRILTLVVATSGDEITVSTPLPEAAARGHTLVFQDECFFFQTALKRRDDLMNRLYHCSVDYRVSALLEDPAARTSAALVLTTHGDVRTRMPRPISDRGGPPPPANPGTGTSAIDIEVEPSHDVH